MEIETLHLLQTGGLPADAVDPTVLTAQGLALYNAMEFCLQRGDVAPLKPDSIVKIAKTKHNLTADGEKLFKQVQSYKPSGPVLETVRDWSILRRVMTVVSEQLAGGKYDLAGVGSLLNVGGPSIVDQHIRLIQKPTKAEKETYLFKTGFAAIDGRIGGVNAELVILAARNKNGKSNFFFNMIERNPKTRFLYITCSDYGEKDIDILLDDLDPKAAGRKNVYSADFNSFSATVGDVEHAIKRVEPQVLIVDRAEELQPVGRLNKEDRFNKKNVFKTLRQYAKKYNIPVFVDSQVGSQTEGDKRKTENRVPEPSDISEDRTLRQALMDLFIGLLRCRGYSKFYLHGRRKNLNGTIVTINTDPEGRYLD